MSALTKPSCLQSFSFYFVSKRAVMGDNDRIAKVFRLLIIPKVTVITPLQSVYFEYDSSTSHFGAVNINSRVEEKIS